MKRKHAIGLLALLLCTAPSYVLASPADDPDDPAYVAKTAVADTAKAKAEAPTLAALAAKAPREVTLVDRKAMPETAALYQYLAALPQTGHILYGHQNDVHHKMFLTDSGSTSDTQDMTGSIAAVVGMDALSLTGAELTLTPAERKAGLTYTAKLVKISEAAHRQGAILTMSMHMPNFAEVAKKGQKNGAWDYSGYSPNNLTGNVGHRILPGQDLNAIYNGYLDLVADYLLQLQAKGTPVIFRPLHEHNGSWFWWGGGNIDEGDFLELWHYTVKYLRDTKGVHNCLYAYSPNGPFFDEGAYLSRYPGDRYVDILGVDTYNDEQKPEWFTNLDKTFTVMQKAAKEHGKLIALTEAGVRDGGALPVTGNRDKRWFQDVTAVCLKHQVPFFLTWANFEKLEHNFFEPYMVSDTRGHEMVNDFIDFYNEPSTIFADGVADFTKLPAPMRKN